MCKAPEGLFRDRSHVADFQLDPYLRSVFLHKKYFRIVLVDSFCQVKEVGTLAVKKNNHTGLLASSRFRNLLLVSLP